MKRNKFSLSYYKLLSMDMGELIPVGLTEVLPGDTIQQATSCLVRCSPLLAPIMHPVNVRIHHWYVPHRLVWSQWEDFITGGPDGMDDSIFPTKQQGPGGASVGSLEDYLGIPPSVPNISYSALPFRGYNLIWNEWYRDQDLEGEAAIDDGSGPDPTTDTNIRHVAWEKDYFTSSRPWEQKGPNITLPLGTTAPITRNGLPLTEEPLRYDNSAADQRVTGDQANAATLITGIATNSPAGGVRTDQPFYTDLTDTVTDLSAASAVTINVLREALALQRYQEARARYGSRYVEYLRYLGVKSSDARLQRPEYLGGGKQTIQFSEVLQTAEGQAPVGEMRGHGIAAARSNRYRRFFEEHGYIFTLLSIRPKTIYVQGMQRTWNRRTKEDFWQMELQHIGQQEVLNKEIYAAHASPDGVFGFQDRYDEYRRMESLVAGEFRTSVLDFWHMARIFSSSPALNASFVSSVPTKRVFAGQDNDVLYVMARHNIQARRMVSSVGTSFIY